MEIHRDQRLSENGYTVYPGAVIAVRLDGLVTSCQLWLCVNLGNIHKSRNAIEEVLIMGDYARCRGKKKTHMKGSANKRFLLRFLASNLGLISVCRFGSKQTTYPSEIVL